MSEPTRQLLAFTLGWYPFLCEVLRAWWRPLEGYKFYFWPINWLPRGHRYLGYRRDWYDGPLFSYGFWWFNVSVSPCEEEEWELRKAKAKHG